MTLLFVLVFHAVYKNTLKLMPSNNTYLLVPNFCISEITAKLSWILCQCLVRLQSRCQPGQRSISPNPYRIVGSILYLETIGFMVACFLKARTEKERERDQQEKEGVQQDGCYALVTCMEPLLPRSHQLKQFTWSHHPQGEGLCQSTNTRRKGLGTLS